MPPHKLTPMQVELLVHLIPQGLNYRITPEGYAMQSATSIQAVSKALGGLLKLGLVRLEKHYPQSPSKHYMYYLTQAGLELSTGDRSHGASIWVWFLDLPVAYQVLAFNNTNPKKLTEEVYSLAGALMEAFYWDKTPEGELFWSQVEQWANAHVRGPLPPVAGRDPHSY